MSQRLRPRRRTAALILTGTLALAACDGTDAPEEGADGGGELAANARAAAVNVSLSDLPEGFGAVSRSDGDDGGGAPLEDCVDGVDDVSVAEASSPLFRLQTDTSLRFVVSETSILSEPAEGERLIESVQDQPVLDCLSDRLGEVFLPEATPETPLVLAPDPQFPDIGDRSVRLAGSATFTREGAPGPIAVTTSLVLVQTGDVVSLLLFGGILEPFPEDTARAVVAAVAERQA